MAMSKTSKVLLAVAGTLLVLFIVGVIGVILVAESFSKPSVPENSVLVLNISGDLPDYVPEDQFAKALGINPEQIYMNSVANVKPVMDGMVAALGAPYINGIITVTYGKDPQDPKWNNDPGMKLYRSIIAKYGGGANPNDPQVAYGVSKAWTFVQLLYRSGKTPTRAGLMNALTSMNYSQPLLLPGMVQKTSRTDRFILSQMQLQRFNGSTRLWVPFGRLIEARPR